MLHCWRQSPGAPHWVAYFPHWVSEMLAQGASFHLLATLGGIFQAGALLLCGGTCLAQGVSFLNFRTTASCVLGHVGGCPSCPGPWMELSRNPLPASRSPGSGKALKASSWLRHPLEKSLVWSLAAGHPRPGPVSECPALEMLVLL